MPSLVWFRADLRVRDNPALHEACRRSGDGVIAVFLLAPLQWHEHDMADIRANFLLRNLHELSADLAALNIPLLVRSAARFSDTTAALLRLAEEHRCEALYFNIEYEVNEARRDEAVRKAFESAGRPVHAFHDHCIIAPGQVRTQQGEAYTVYTPFRKRWTQVFKEEMDFRVLPKPKKQARLAVKADAIPDQVDGFKDFDREDLWPAGEAAARKRLEGFVGKRIGEYAEQRDCPAVAGTSTLSPYLAVGVVSARQCLEAALGANEGRLDAGDKGVTTWINELIWREFYRHLIARFPRLCMNRPFQRDTERLAWHEDEGLFSAWAQGRTGYPIVDAAMRQLLQTGWMHNRLRMVSAMFLTKDLFIDWRRGEKHFMRHLIDGDLASNNGGWQWSASTGTDAAPYFRIFNPASQAKRYDPEGTFIRRFLPELAHAQTAALHDPLRLSEEERRKAGYPAPIVDHAGARAHAIAAFRGLRG